MSGFSKTNFLIDINPLKDLAVKSLEKVLTPNLSELNDSWLDEEFYFEWKSNIEQILKRFQNIG